MSVCSCFLWSDKATLRFLIVLSFISFSVKLFCLFLLFYLPINVLYRSSMKWGDQSEHIAMSPTSRTWRACNLICRNVSPPLPSSWYLQHWMVGRGNLWSRFNMIILHFVLSASPMCGLLFSIVSRTLFSIWYHSCFQWPTKQTTSQP